MPHPGPNSEEELLDFLFKNPKEEGGRPCNKVLFVELSCAFRGPGGVYSLVVHPVVMQTVDIAFHKIGAGAAQYVAG